MKWVVKFTLPCIESASASGSSTDVVGDLLLATTPFESLLTSTFPIISYFLESHNILHGAFWVPENATFAWWKNVRLSSAMQNVVAFQKKHNVLHGDVLHGAFCMAKNFYATSVPNWKKVREYDWSETRRRRRSADDWLIWSSTAMLCYYCMALQTKLPHTYLPTYYSPTTTSLPSLSCLPSDGSRCFGR